MQKRDFIIQENNGYLRRTNWEDYIKSIDTFSVHKKNTFTIIMIAYNNVINTKNMLEYISKEKEKSHMDCIIIDNSTDEKIKVNNKELCKKYTNTIYIETTDNIGSDGGYSLGMEYAIQNGYEYMAIVEDDVILIDSDTFSAAYKARDKNTVMYINDSKNSDNDRSQCVQFGCFPKNFIEKCGICDPRYFIRAGDLERVERIKRIVTKYHYDTIILDKNYLHPYLKKGNGSVRRIYFSIRNQLFMHEKYFSMGKGAIMKIFFFYLRYGWSKYVIENDSVILSTVLLGIIDFFFHRIGITHNNNRLHQLIHKKITQPKPEQEFELPRSEIGKYTQDKVFIANHFGFTAIDVKNTPHSRGWKNFWNNGAIINGYFYQPYPIRILAPRFVAINEFDLINDTASLSIYNNQFAYRFIKVAFSLLLTLITSIIILPLILIKALIYKIYYSCKR